ncbi:MAG: hypothetical protein WDW38_005079 [Sanguina aurantia]
MVLGIESSCDDTGAAIVTSDGRVLGEALASQADIHAAWGGVVPKLAMEAHQAAIDGVVELALQRAGIAAHQLDAVAVTIGPGLGLCLRVGVTKANELSRQHGLPLIHIHHMEAHALVARLGSGAPIPTPVPQPLTPAPSLQSHPITSVAHPQHSAAPPHSTAAGLSSSERSSSERSSSERSSSERSSSDSSSGNRAAAAHTTLTAAQDHSPATATQQHITQTGQAAHQGRRERAGGGAPPGPDPIVLQPAVPFPFLCLLVSGGHNLLVLVTGVGQYVQLGTTLDDALGEAYDKVARLLQLDPRPSGGAALEQLAKSGDPRAIPFAIPMWQRLTCDFSYAGLKTSARLAIQANLPDPGDPSPAAQQTPNILLRGTSSPGLLPPAHAEGGRPGRLFIQYAAASQSRRTSLFSRTSSLPTKPPPTAHASSAHPAQMKADLAASFQYVAVQHLTQRVVRGTAWARELQPGLQHLVVAGGVASNQYVRQQLMAVAAEQGLTMTLPPPRWCVDNGVMVAWAGMERLALGLVEPALPALPVSMPQGASLTALAEQTDSMPGTSSSGGGGGGSGSGTATGHVSSDRVGSSSNSSSSSSEDASRHQGGDTSSSGAPEAVGVAVDSPPNAVHSSSQSGSESAPVGVGRPLYVEGGVSPGTYKSDAVIGSEDWVTLKPRWPLTSEKHPRCMSDSLSQKSARKVRLHTSLNTLMLEQQQQQPRPDSVMGSLRAAEAL